MRVLLFAGFLLFVSSAFGQQKAPTQKQEMHKGFYFSFPKGVGVAQHGLNADATTGKMLVADVNNDFFIEMTVLPWAPEREKSLCDDKPRIKNYSLVSSKPGTSAVGNPSCDFVFKSGKEILALRVQQLRDRAVQMVAHGPHAASTIAAVGRSMDTYGVLFAQKMLVWVPPGFRFTKEFADGVVLTYDPKTAVANVTIQQFHDKENPSKKIKGSHQGAGQRLDTIGLTPVKHSQGQMFLFPTKGSEAAVVIRTESSTIEIKCSSPMRSAALCRSIAEKTSSAAHFLE